MENSFDEASGDVGSRSGFLMSLGCPHEKTVALDTLLLRSSGFAELYRPNNKPEMAVAYKSKGWLPSHISYKFLIPSHGLLVASPFGRPPNQGSTAEGKEQWQNHTMCFKASPHLQLVKASHMAKPAFKGAGNMPLP